MSVKCLFIFLLFFFINEKLEENFFDLNFFFEFKNFQVVKMAKTQYPRNKIVYQVEKLR
jgi:hypothetical protein